MTRFACTVMILMLAVAAHADIYKWVDRQGTVNYTQDFGKIPKKYRKTVTVISEGEAPVAEVTEAVVDQTGNGKRTEQGQKDTGSAPVAGHEKKTIYGDRDENTWKTEFRVLRNEINATEAQLSARRTRLASPGAMSRGEYLGIQREAKTLEETLAGLHGKLNALEESAQRAGVPLELRK